MFTRRDALRGGTATLAAIAAGGAVAAAVPDLTGSDARLEELGRAWRAAEAEYCRLCDHWADLPNAAPQWEQDQADAERNAANERAGDAMLALAAAPAAGLHGVLIKLDVWEDDGGDERECTETVRESAFADLRRLAGEAQS